MYGLYLSANLLCGEVPEGLASVPENDLPDTGFPKCNAAQVKEDRAALMALYEATDGDNWADNTNWGTDEPLVNWYGVSTNAQGRVTVLNLYQ